MSVRRSLDPETATYARWRLARGYAASRRLPGYWLMMLILLGMVLWGREWGQEHAPTTLRMLVFLLPVALASVIGVSLWSPFGEPERAAGRWLPLGRCLHLVTMLALALLVNRVAVETWVPDGDAGRWGLYLLRHTVALIGITLLSVTILDSRLSWIGPALVAMPGLVVGYIRVEQAASQGREVAFFHDPATHLMLRPHDSPMAAGVAIALFIAGVVVVIRRGERLAEPDDTAG
ncbi:MAG: hypothetical protein M3412_03765 [Chloroflexota bacterium]|nr:hypothetical protein [Chloroflexota bacterium]